MPRYFEHFGLERDPFLDTSDPHFYLETPSARAHKRRLLTAVEESRGLTIVVGETGTGKTSLCSYLEFDLLAQERWIVGKILDPSFGSDVEFLVAIGRVFGLSLPPRSRTRSRTSSSIRSSSRAKRSSSSSTRRKTCATTAWRRCGSS